MASSSRSALRACNTRTSATVLYHPVALPPLAKAISVAQVARPRRRGFGTTRYLKDDLLEKARTAAVGETSPSKTLGHILADSIKASGPVSVATFMRTCLLDPSQGYYASANQPGSEAIGESGRDVLGARGDFITSPEISQVFGELLAVYFVARWQAVGSPTQLRLVELGPGKGTLLADMIRTFARFQVLNSVKTIHLVETSEGLMRIQLRAIEEALTAAGKKIAMPDTTPEDLGENEVKVEYFPVVDSVPVVPSQWTMLVAHEFFDALPIHVFERTVNGFREVLVDVDRTSPGPSSGSNGKEGVKEERRQSGVTTIKVSDLRGSRSSSSKSPGASASGSQPFRYVLSPTETPWTRLLASANPRFQSLQPGQRVEVSPEGWATARRIGELVSGRQAGASKEAHEQLGRNVEQAEEIERERLEGQSLGGAALVVDYGDEKAFGGSFRAFKSHKIVDPLVAPGSADLTANVDFSYLKNALDTTDARGLGPIFQSHFLTSLGLSARVEALVKNAPDASRKSAIQSAAKRLIDPLSMGAQYKVLGVEGGSSGVGASYVPDGDRVYPFDYMEELKKGSSSSESSQ